MSVRGVTSAGLAVLMLACVSGASHAASGVPSPSASLSSSSSSPDGPSAAPTATTVLAPAAMDSGAPPSAAGLARVLGPLLRNRALGRRVGAAVVDAATGELLYAVRGSAALTPASTTKLLTAAAVLATAGPDARLTTQVVRVPGPAAVPASPSPAPSPTGFSWPAPFGPPTGFAWPTPTASPAGPARPTPSAASEAPAPPAEIILIGGGDPTLTALPGSSPALAGYPSETSLGQLAARTARALREDGVTRVRLSYDDSLYTGPTASAGWLPGYVIGAVGRVSALQVDQGRVRRPGGVRVKDPAVEAIRRFSALLVKNGIVVVGRSHRRAAPPGAVPLASVRSASLATLVEHMLEASDNDIAEALARQVALATGGPASFEGAARAVVASMQTLGIDTAGVRLHDGSGLSRGNRIPAVTLAQVLRVAASPEHPELRAVLTGLPVAGFTGTLGRRFLRAPAARGAGLVRGKTGTLSGVTSLAGVVPDASGQLLAYAFVADAIPSGRSLAARNTVDLMAAALVACGCR